VLPPVLDLFCLEARVKRKDDFIMQNVGGENLLVPLGVQMMNLNGLVILSDTGAYVWELLAAERTLDELAMAVADQFEVDETTARGDVQAFLDEIARLGMVE
jgi:proteasome assembly chaperone (PAC2) family protein